MALGYEGWVNLGGTYALGTGASVPRGRIRIESSSGYGGSIDNPSTRGIGLPYTYDWETWDGNINFEMTDGIWTKVADWISHRQTAKEVRISPRTGGSQVFSNSFWNSITVGVSEQSAVDGSCGFVALGRDSYSYGTGLASIDGWKLGSNVIPFEQGPIPYWDATVTLSGNIIEFINWSLSLSQDVVKFYACEYNISAVEPKYLAVGPMTVVFSGAYMMGSSFLGDSIDLTLNIGAGSLTLRRCEVTTEQDDVVDASSFTPLTVEYAVYELSI